MFRTVHAAAAERAQVAEDLDERRACAELDAQRRAAEGNYRRRIYRDHRWVPGYYPDAEERAWLDSLTAPPPPPHPLVRVVARLWSGPIQAAPTPAEKERDTRGRAELARAAAEERAAARIVAQAAARKWEEEKAERWRLAKIAREEAAARAAAHWKAEAERWRKEDEARRARYAAKQLAEEQRQAGLLPTLKIAARDAEGKPERLLIENFWNEESAEECAEWYRRKRGWICRVVSG